MPRATRRCGQPACDQPMPCATHERERRQREDRARPPAVRRGYDKAFEKAKRDPGFVAATTCETCGCAFTATNPKTAGHRIALRLGKQSNDIFPQCRRCNYGWRRSGT